MTKPPSISRPNQVDASSKRKEMMRVMAQFSLNSAAVTPERQEELASFMVDHLRSAIS